MNRHWLVAFVVLFAALIPSALPVYADLLVAPTRVVLDDRTRSTFISLSNTTQETRTYRVGWQEYTAQEDGSYMVPPAPRGDSAALQKMLRFSPRQVTLAPGEVQSVRLLLRPGEEIPEGEMRTHLTFTALPPERPAEAPDSAGIGIDLRFALAISIPVIYRKGALTSQAQISTAKLETVLDEQQQPKSILSVSIERSGDQSVFGDIEVVTASGKTIGLLRGVAVYLEVPRRIVRLPIDLAPGADSSGLKVRLKLPATEGGAVLAEMPVGR